MVGDRKHDILGARHNDLFAVGVTYGYGNEAELTEAEPIFSSIPRRKSRPPSPK